MHLYDSPKLLKTDNSTYAGSQSEQLSANINKNESLNNCNVADQPCAMLVEHLSIHIKF